MSIRTRPTDNVGTAMANAAYRGNRDLVVLLLAQPHIKVDVPDAERLHRPDVCGRTWFGGHRGYAGQGRSRSAPQKLVGDRRPRIWLKEAWRRENRPSPTFMSAEEWLKGGCYHWVQGMTVLDAIHAAGGFTNFVAGPILITHLDGTCVTWDYPPPHWMPPTRPRCSVGTSMYLCAFSERSRS